MAKPKRKKRKSPGGHTPPPIDIEGVLSEVEVIHARLSQADEGPLWGDLQRLLVKAGVDPSRVAVAVIGRDLDVIRQLVDHARNPELALPEKEPETVLPEFPEETLREALRAFRKRMKLTKLDHESKLGRNPLTTGKAADFDSILPQAS